MLKRRLIPVILLRNGVIVQSKGFKRYQMLGNPTTVVRRMSDWAADELLYLDISPDAVYDLRRDDLKSENRGTIVEIIKDVAEHAFMPLTFGGGIRTMDDVLGTSLAPESSSSISTSRTMRSTSVIGTGRLVRAMRILSESLRGLNGSRRPSRLTTINSRISTFS